MARILVVEDDATMREDIAYTLGDWGHEVVMADDGSRGFKAIETWRPDLVLSDINMPRETGLDLVNKLAGLGTEYADMPFIFISSLKSPKAMVFGIQCGADDYITKPIDYDLLRVKINAHLKKKESLISKITVDKLALSMSQKMVGGAMTVCVAGGLGTAVVIVVYWIKSVLGIDIFGDAHFSDLF